MFRGVVFLAHFVAPTIDLHACIWLYPVFWIFPAADLSGTAVRVVSACHNLADVRVAFALAVFAILAFVMVLAVLVGVTLDWLTFVFVASVPVAVVRTVVVDSTFLFFATVPNAQTVTVCTMAK